MATLRNTMSAMQDNNPENPAIASEQFASATAVAQALQTPITAQTHRIFKLVNTKRNGRVHISGIDDVIDPVTKRLTRIRLLSGFESIWQKDQKDLPEDFVKMNQRSLTFENKILSVPVYDTQALEFISVCRSNIKSPNKTRAAKHPFFEWDPEEMQKEQLKKRRFKLDAIKLALGETDMNRIRKHCSFLKIPMMDMLGFPLTDSGLSDAYALYAEQNPDIFMTTREDPRINISWLVKRAIIDAKIDLGKQPNTACWANGGGFICKVPDPSKATEYLIELAMLHTDEGKQFLMQLQENVR
jgi:hypothetical protein